MDDCVNAGIRDRLPDLLGHRLEPDERLRLERHVASCVECAAELRILRTARQAMSRTPAIDTPAIARAVVRRSRARREHARWWAVPASSRVLRVAAAALMVVAGGTTVVMFEQSHRPPTPVVAVGGTQAPVASAPIMAMTPASPATPVPAAGAQTAGLSLAGALGELTDDQLQTLLDDLGSMSAVPATDPEPVLPALPTTLEGGA